MVTLSAITGRAPAYVKLADYVQVVVISIDISQLKISDIAIQAGGRASDRTVVERAGAGPAVQCRVNPVFELDWPPVGQSTQYGQSDNLIK